ncbi:zinc uptake transcriptional repressor Zur [Enterobacteriaceae bacterium LUAb1]
MPPLTIASLLMQAEQLCQQRNVRLTPQRLEILRLMADQHGAISAYDLLDLLRKSKPQAKPPTVYRALDFLLEQGFIHRVESTNSYVVCHHFTGPSHTSALLICDSCGSVDEQQAQGVEDILQKISQQCGFTLHHNVVEAHGACLQCKAVERCDDHEHSTRDNHVLAGKKRGR